MSKGSERRPINSKYCTYEEFGEKWDRIFGPSKLDIEEEEKKETVKKEDVCLGNCSDSSSSQS